MIACNSAMIFSNPCIILFESNRAASVRATCSKSSRGIFSIIPIGAVGALLILAGSDLAISRRLFDGKPSCWPVIGVTALVTLTINPTLGLILGWMAELIRAAIVRSVYRTTGL